MFIPFPFDFALLTLTYMKKNLNPFSWNFEWSYSRVNRKNRDINKKKNVIKGKELKKT